jgi:hypothetical protein
MRGGGGPEQLWQRTTDKYIGLVVAAGSRSVLCLPFSSRSSRLVFDKRMLVP